MYVTVAIPSASYDSGKLHSNISDVKSHVSYQEGSCPFVTASGFKPLLVSKPNQAGGRTLRPGSSDACCLVTARCTRAVPNSGMPKTLCLGRKGPGILWAPLLALRVLAGLTSAWSRAGTTPALISRQTGFHRDMSLDDIDHLCHCLSYAEGDADLSPQAPL